MTGWTFGRGGDLSVRIYDKTEELRFRVGDAASAEARQRASDKAAEEAEIWARHGWQAGEPVTRVEVQVRGTALNELCKRLETKVREHDSPEDYERAVDEACEAMVLAFESALDGIWQYATRKWLRHVVPTSTRTTRCPTSDWWAEVQEVSFIRPGEPPLRRVRRRSVVRSSQALGAVLSVITMHGEHSPWIDTRGGAGAWTLPDEKRAAWRAEQLHGGAKYRLAEEVARALAAAAPIIVSDLVTSAGSDMAALERLIVRWSAATCRFAPGAPDRPDNVRAHAPCGGHARSAS